MPFLPPNQQRQSTEGKTKQYNTKQVIALVAARQLCPLPMAVGFAADLRPSTDGPQSAHLWWPAVAKLQAASVPIA